MQWAEVRARYPDRWLVVEFLAGPTVEGRRHFDRVEVVEVCPDGRAAMKRCGAVQRAHPEHDYVFAHTSRLDLVVYERSWVGVRWGDAVDPAA